MEWIRSKEKLALGWLSTTFTCLACGVLWLAFIVLSSPPASATPPPPDQPNSPKVTSTPMRITGEQPTSEYETATPPPASITATSTTGAYPPPAGTVSATRTPTPPAPGSTATPSHTRTPSQVVAGQLRVVFLEVGQGMSILILAPGGQAALVDGGRPEDGPGVLNSIRQFGVTRLDLLIATHPHEAHLGGLVDVLQAMPVAKIVVTGQSNVSGAYNEFLSAANASSAEMVAAGRGTTFSLGELSLRIYNPATANPTGDINRNSMVIRFVYGQKAFLLTGDADKDAQSSVLSSGMDLPSDILQLTDFCDPDQYLASFVQTVHPAYAVCTDGDHVPDPYPAPGAADVLAQLGAVDVRTDERGKIIFSSDGTTIHITTDR